MMCFRVHVHAVPYRVASPRLISSVKYVVFTDTIQCTIGSRTIFSERRATQQATVVPPKTYRGTGQIKDHPTKQMQMANNLTTAFCQPVHSLSKHSIITKIVSP